MRGGGAVASIGGDDAAAFFAAVLAAGEGPGRAGGHVEHAAKVPCCVHSTTQQKCRAACTAPTAGGNERVRSGARGPPRVTYRAAGAALRAASGQLR
jgi:hypothetical protein